jgi:type I restriction enzyme, S subunit
MAEVQLPHGYKQTEVGVIPEDWEVIDLARLCTLQRGFDITEATRVTGTVPVYSSSGLAYYHNKAMVSPPGVVTGRKGILGKVFLINEPFWPHDTTLWVKDFKGNHPAYVALVLQNFHLERLDAATSVPTLNRNNLAGYPIAVPPTKAEQEAIAEALSDVDALIESLVQLIAKKRQIKQGVMQELLTGKKRLPGFSGEWEVKLLGDLASIQRGASPRPIDSPIWFADNSSIGWVRISDVTRSGMFLRETTQRLSTLGIQHSRPVSRGSLIMSICATVGRPVITEIDICIHDGFVVFDNLGTDKHFMYYTLKSIEGDWARHGQTGSQMNLNTGLINRTKITMPPTAEQTAITAILTDMDAELAALEEKLAKARQLKQGMMQELLTGRIRLV